MARGDPGLAGRADATRSSPSWSWSPTTNSTRRCVWAGSSPKRSCGCFPASRATRPPVTRRWAWSRAPPSSSSATTTSRSTRTSSTTWWRSRSVRTPAWCHRNSSTGTTPRSCCTSACTATRPGRWSTAFRTERWTTANTTPYGTSSWRRAAASSYVPTCGASWRGSTPASSPWVRTSTFPGAVRWPGLVSWWLPIARVRHREAVASGAVPLEVAGVDTPGHPVTLQALQRRHELRTVLKCYTLFHLIRVLPQAALLAFGEVVVALCAREPAASPGRGRRLGVERPSTSSAPRAAPPARRPPPVPRRRGTTSPTAGERAAQPVSLPLVTSRIRSSQRRGAPRRRRAGCSRLRSGPS